MSTKRQSVLVVVLCAAVGIAVGTFAPRAAAPIAVEERERYQPADSATATAIGRRATEYWMARTRLDLYGAYPFYETGFRSTYSPEAFVKAFQRLNRFTPQLVTVDRIEVDTAGTRAKVTLTLRSKADVAEGQELITTQEDMWVLENGTWSRQAEAMTPTI